MRPAMSENRDFQAAAREHLFAQSEAAAAWLPGQRRLNGPAAILPTATSRGDWPGPMSRRRPRRTEEPDGYVYVASLGANTITRLLIQPTAPPTGAALTAHGSASVAGNVFTLTTAGGGAQAGTAMSTGRIDVRQNFTIGFDVNLGADDAGADGAAFVLQNDPAGVNAIGSAGGGLGAYGLQKGLGIEFDTYNGGTASGDIAADHTNFIDTDDAFATTPVALPNLEDGAWHPVVVSWNAATQTL